MKKRKLLLVFSSLTLYLMAFSAQAQTPILPGGGSGIGQNIVEAINRLRESITDWLNAARDALFDKLYEENGSYPATVTGNTALASSAGTIKDLVNGKMQPELKELLTQENQSINQRVLSTVPASDSYQKPSTTGVAALFGGQKPEKNASASNEYFNAATLLAGTAYDTEQAQKSAAHYLEYLSQSALPLTTINISDLTDVQREKIDTLPKGREWRINVRARLAEYTMAKDNLWRFYNERIPQADLGEKAGIPETKDASILQLEEYLATRRVKDKSWYAIMAQSAPTTLLREMVYQEAELNHQLFQLRMENQRIVALLSVIVLQNLQAAKPQTTASDMELKSLLGGK
jgi:hypothetical protein